MTHRLRRSVLLLSLLVSINSPAAWKKHVIQPGTGTRGMVNDVNTSDFDRDGKIDAICSHSGAVWLYPTLDAGKRLKVYEFPKELSGRKLRAGCIHATLMDVDGDGDQDYIGSNNLVFWLECPKRPLENKWTLRIVDDKILGTHCLITADVDRDGKLDLIANSGRASGTPFANSLAWLRVPKKPLSAQEWIRHIFADGDAPGASHYSGFGDLNGDGRGDIAFGAKGGEKFPGGEWFAWWEQPKNPTEFWKKHMLSSKEPGASNIIPVDLNNDGAMDLFASRGHGKGTLWFKGPSFELIDVDPDIIGPHSLAIGDIDGDGDPDAATCGYLATGTSAWYENDGKGQFKKHVIGTGQGSYDIRLVDLDDDGDLDVLLAGHFNQNVVWYENPGKQ